MLRTKLSNSATLLIFLLASAAASSLTGCGTGGVAASYTPTTGSTPVVTVGNTSGNWQGPLTATGGTQALGVLSGSIDQSGGTTTAGQFTTAVFRIASTCFVPTPSIPSQGFILDGAVSLNSFAVEHQYLTLTGTTSNAGATIGGTYVVNGGCADGSKGNFTINRYNAFTGTYVGTANAGQTISLTSTQADGGDGTGAFPLTATATLGGFSCFTKGNTLATNNPTISGASVNLTLTTDDKSGGLLQIAGTLSQDASTLSAVTFTVLGGNCAGQSGTISLARQ